MASHIVPGTKNVEYLDYRIIFEFVSNQTHNIFSHVFLYLNRDVDGIFFV